MLEKAAQKEVARRRREGDEWRVVCVLRTALATLLLCAAAATVTFCVHVCYDRMALQRDVVRCVAQALPQGDVATAQHVWLHGASLLGVQRVGVLLPWHAQLQLAVLTTPSEAADEAAQSTAAVAVVLHAATTCLATRSVHASRDELRVWRVCGRRFCVQVHEARMREGDDDVIDIAHDVHALPRKAVLPLRACKVHDVKLPCPHNTTAVLTRQYGDTWATMALL